MNNKKEALKVLEELPDKVLIRIATLAKNPNAVSFFTCPLKFGVVKSFLSNK